MATTIDKCCLKQITSSSCNEHILKVLNNVKCPPNERPKNRKSVAMKTLVAEIAKKAITYKFSCHLTSTVIYTCKILMKFLKLSSVYSILILNKKLKLNIILVDQLHPHAKFDFNPSRHFCDTVWNGSVTTLIMCYYQEFKVTLIYGTYLWPVTYTCRI